MKTLHFLSNLFILSLWTTFSGFSQYEISLSMKTKNDTVMLTHIFAKEQSRYLDTTIVLKNGKGVFKGKKTLPKGLYAIYNNNRKIDILIGNSQKFGIVVDTVDIINNIRFISSPDNDAFYDFFRYEIPHSAKMRQLEEQYKNAVDDTGKKTIIEQWQALGKERMSLIKKLINDNEHLYISKFLKAMFVPLEIPEPPRDDLGRITDSTFQYRWYRTHFFDNYDIYDPDMLRTPLYEKKVTEYMTLMQNNHPLDTIYAEIDRMLAKSKPNKEVFRCMLATIYNHFINSNLLIRENFWVHLVDNWYVPYADWDVKVDEMKKAADKIRPTLIGKVAPPLDQLMLLSPDHFKAAALDTAIKNDVHAGKIIPDFRKSIQSKYLVLLFWEVTCGHCKSAIQELWEIYQACKDKGLQVLAIQTLINRDGKVKWIDFINEHGMYDWYNGWIIYDLKWHDLYIHGEGVPKVYLLNEKKEIVLRGNFKYENIQIFIEADAAKK